MSPRRRRGASRGVGLVCALLAWGGGARADGQALVTRGTAGAYELTVLASPTPIRAGLVEWSILVRDPADGSVRLDVPIGLALRPVSDAADAHGPLLAQAMRAASTNRLLSTASVELPAPGRWRITARVLGEQRGGALEFEIEVAPAAGVVAEHWRALAVAPLALGCFSLHQWLVHRRRAGR